MKYQVFVTISGMFEDGQWNYLDVLLESPLYDTFDEAERWYDAMHVKPFGAMAVALHANHPECRLIEAEYDIYSLADGFMDDFDTDWFYNESIWWADDETYWSRQEDRCL